MKKLKKIIIYVSIFYVAEAMSVFRFSSKMITFSGKNISSFPEIQFKKNDRVLIMSPHPDDAALAASGVIEKCITKGAKVKIIYVTYGSHNTRTMIKKQLIHVPTPIGAIALGKTRHNEAVKAMESLELKKNNLIFLGFPDFGTLKIWTDHFNNRPYFSAITMHDDTFYKTAYKTGISFTATNELALLENMISSFNPTKIFFPPTSDLNSDHRATGLFTEAALFDLRNAVHPEEYTYFVHSESWPVPKGLHYDLYLTPPIYVRNINKNWYIVSLNKREELKKKKAIENHKTQLETSPAFMYSFVRRNEIFLKFNKEKTDSLLPLWTREKMEKLHITPFIESAKLSKGEKYTDFYIKLYKGILPFSKLSIFLYPERTDMTFSNAPKYQIAITRDINKKLSVQFTSKGKRIFTASDELRVNSKESTLDIEVNNKYLLNSPSFFSAIQIEQNGIRISETPWWNIKL